MSRKKDVCGPLVVFCSFGEKRVVNTLKETKSQMTFQFNVEKERLDDVFEKAERRRNEAGIDPLHVIAANIVCAFVSAKCFDSAKIKKCFGVVMQHCSAAVEELRRLPLFHERLGSATLMGVTPAQQFSLEAVRSVFSAYVIMVRHDLATSYAAYSAGLDSAIACDDIDWIASCLLGQANATSKVKVNTAEEKTVRERVRLIDETRDKYAARLSADYVSSLMTLKGKILFAQLGDNEAGAECLRLAVARRPNNAGALALLGRCLLRINGKKHEAVDFLKRSLDNTPTDNLAIETVLHYAEALAAVRRFTEAKEQYRRVADLARTKYHRSRVPFYLRKCAESYFYNMNKQELAKDLAEEALAKSAELPVNERDAVDIARAHSLSAMIA